MKAIAINGSPRKGWNTEKLLREALRGAQDAGAETKLVQLYDLHFTGCKSCFGCKRKGAESCHCVLKDELTPVLEEIYRSDVLLLGSPVYLGDVSGHMVCLLERLGFPLISYDDYARRLYDGHINAGFLFTMNMGRDYCMQSDTWRHLLGRAGLLERLGGRVETCAACDTYQFADYARVHAGTFDEAHKAQVREEQFPRDLEAAYRLGYELTKA